MSPFSRLLIVGLLSSLCSAAPHTSLNEAFVAKRALAVDVNTLFKGIQPTVIKAGPITKAQIAKVVLPKPGAVIALNGAGFSLSAAKRDIIVKPSMENFEKRSSLQRRLVRDGAAFADQPKGNLPTGAKPFELIGPFKTIQIACGATGVTGIRVVDMVGAPYQLGSMAEGAGITVGKVFTFEDNEIVSSFSVPFSSKTGNIYGINFTTNRNKNYLLYATGGTPDQRVINPTIASGILGRIRGWSNANSNNPDVVYFDFLSVLTTIKVLGYTYDGFTNGKLTVKGGERTVIANQAINNTGSSPISTQFSSTATVARESSWSLSEHFNIGASFSFATEVEIPLLPKVTTTETASVELGVANTNGKTTTTTTMSAQSFTLTCAPKLYCVGTASLMRFKLDLQFTALVEGKTQNGATFQWNMRGSYKGTDSTSALFVVQNFDIGG